MKLATIGTSWITDSFIDAAQKSGRFELWAVYSRQWERAEKFARKHGAHHVSDSLEGLSSSGPDAVYIASPNALHYGQADFFLRRGIHVICEKPAVTREGELTALFETARRHGAYFFEALWHLHTPGFNSIKRNISSIAPVRSAFISYGQYSSRYDRFLAGEMPGVFDPALGGGAKFDLGVYPVSVAAALFGRPRSALYAPVTLRDGVNGAGAFILAYDGFTVSVSFSKITEDVTKSQITGENGGIRFGRPHELKSDIMLVSRDGGETDISERQHENHLVYECVAFADIVAGDDEKSFWELAKISEITNEILLGKAGIRGGTD